MEARPEETDATAPNAPFTVLSDPVSMPSADDIERTHLDVGRREHHRAAVDAEMEDRLTQQTTEDMRDLAPMQPPRDNHLEQELVDYESEDADIVPESNPTRSKSTTTGGDKPMPPKISWNEWAGADAETGRKSDDRRRDPLENTHRAPIDARMNRDHAKDDRGRYRRNDGYKSHKDNRYPREPTPRRPYHRGSNARPGDGPLRRGLATMHADIPPGMSRGHTFGPQRFMSSGMEAMPRSVRPAASRLMPPGLGVTGSLPRDGPLPSRQPVDDRRLPIRDARHRSMSPPRYLPQRRPSPERYRKIPRQPSLHQMENEMPMETRPRSPYGNRLPMDEHRYPHPRVVERNGAPQEREGEDDRRRPNPDYSRNKDSTRASPRRFIPDRRQAFQRHPVPRFNEGDRYHHSGNPNRIPVAGQWPSPRGDRRRPLSLERPGVRHPPPQPQSRRYPRDVSPSRHRREMGSPPRRHDPPGRPQPHGRGRPMHPRPESDYRHRFEGTQHRRYNDRRRDPPPSPGRSKRQRQSPMAEQRSQRDPAHLRGAALSPHENPPDTDGLSVGLLRHSETDCSWYYVDPRGNTQGPCTIAQFRNWLRTLAAAPQFADEHKQFMSVEVWKEGAVDRYLMTELLDKNIP